MLAICNYTSSLMLHTWLFLVPTVEQQDIFTSRLVPLQIKLMLGGLVHPSVPNAGLSSATEAGCAALFHNCTVAVGICHALLGLGHSQHCTDVIIDNPTANRFVHSKMRVKRSKSWDMQCNLLRDQNAQQQFKFRWDLGIHNLADYFTKHHPPSHHCIKRHDYILKGF